MQKNQRGRPPTGPVELKEGYYIKIKSKGSSSSVKVRRDSKTKMEMAIKQYRNSKIVTYLGQVKNGKWIDGENKGKKAI